MAQIKVPYFAWRDGRPRWSPGPALRARGFKGKDLKDANGQWLSEADAMIAASALNAGADAARTHGLAIAVPAALTVVKSVPAPQPKKQSKLVAEVIGEYLKIKCFDAEATERVYRYYCRLIRDWTGDVPVEDVTLQAMNAFYAQTKKVRGLPTANQLWKIFNIVLNFAVDNDWLTVNRATRVELKKTKGRIVIWNDEELDAFDTAALGLDRMSIADGVFLGSITTQRPSDLIPLTDENIDEDYLRLTQKKTGNDVSIRIIDKTRARLDALAARKAQRWPNVINPHLLICETTGLVYNDSNFRKQFRAVRAEAAKLCPSILSKRFSDLRDTGVTRLAEAECTIPEIATMTGHSLKSVAQILDKHYFKRTDELADSAGSKLEAYLNRKKGVGNGRSKLRANGG